MQILKAFIAGVAILIGAIVINGFAMHFKITTWYDYLKSKKKKKLNLLSILFLFIIYPLLLGAIACCVLNFLAIIF
jgi:hypothetical protein